MPGAMCLLQVRGLRFSRRGRPTRFTDIRSAVSADSQSVEEPGLRALNYRSIAHAGLATFAAPTSPVLRSRFGMCQN